MAGRARRRALCRTIRLGGQRPRTHRRRDKGMEHSRQPVATAHGSGYESCFGPACPFSGQSRYRRLQPRYGNIPPASERCEGQHSSGKQEDICLRHAQRHCRRCGRTRAPCRGSSCRHSGQPRDRQRVRLIPDAGLSPALFRPRLRA